VDGNCVKLRCQTVKCRAVEIFVDLRESEKCGMKEYYRTGVRNSVPAKKGCG